MNERTNGHRALGRLPPSDWKHHEKYPYAAVAPATVQTVERTLPLSIQLAMGAGRPLRRWNDGFGASRSRG